ncbi:hypothetical protein HaLaN_18955, partial [Haematococcus lacustris]
MWDCELRCFTAWQGLRQLQLCGVGATWPDRQEVDGGQLQLFSHSTALQALALQGVSLPLALTLPPAQPLTAAQQQRRRTKQHMLRPCPVTFQLAEAGRTSREGVGWVAAAAPDPALAHPPGMASSSVRSTHGSWSRLGTSCLQRLSLSTTPSGPVRLPPGLLLPPPSHTRVPAWATLTQLILGGSGSGRLAGGPQAGVDGSGAGGVLLAGELERLGRLPALRHLVLACPLDSSSLVELVPGCLQQVRRLTLTASLATGDLANLLRSQALHPDCHLELGCWLGLYHAANSCGLARDAAALAAHPGSYSCLLMEVA